MPPTSPHTMILLNCTGTQLPANASYPHLSLNGQIQIHHSCQSALHDAATSLSYFDYLQTKFKWLISLETTIHWLKSSSLPFQTIWKRNPHKNSYTNGYHSKTATTWNHLNWTNLPIVPSDKGNSGAYLACNHPDRQVVWKDLHHSLEKHAFQNAVSPTLHDLYAYRLYMGCSQDGNNYHTIYQTYPSTNQSCTTATWLATSHLWLSSDTVAHHVPTPAPNNQQYPLLHQVPDSYLERNEKPSRLRKNR